MRTLLSFGTVKGLPSEEAAMLADLVKLYNSHLSTNKEKEKYYNGDIALDEVNLGLALPDGLGALEIGCEWGAKTVDVLASRSMFDGFVGKNGTDNNQINEIAEANNLKAQYAKVTKDELKFGCTFATLSKDPAAGGCRIRFHSPLSAAARWDGAKGRIGYGFAIISNEEISPETYQPNIVNLYTDTDIWVLRRNSNLWTAERYPHRMGRLLMEPVVWNPTNAKPLGRSRLKGPIRKLMQGYVRTIANATIGLEFSTSPQKYILGVTDEQYDVLINDKFKQYVGSILTSTVNPETGEKPTFGQLAQGSIEPHVQMMRLLATQFSAATGLSVVDTGVINDANPTSSDAILAQSQTLVLMAEQLNAGNAGSLYTIAQMALAVANDTSMEELDEAQRDIIAHFKNPAMPSVAVTADAAIKIASARPEFAGTDTFLEMIGFDQADVRRIKAQEQRARGQQILELEFSDADQPEDMDEI